MLLIKSDRNLIFTTMLLDSNRTNIHIQRSSLSFQNLRPPYLLYNNLQNYSSTIRFSQIRISKNIRPPVTLHLLIAMLDFSPQLRTPKSPKKNLRLRSDSYQLEPWGEDSSLFIQKQPIYQSPKVKSTRVRVVSTSSSQHKSRKIKTMLPGSSPVTESKILGLSSNQQSVALRPEKNESLSFKAMYKGMITNKTRTRFFSKLNENSPYSIFMNDAAGPRLNQAKIAPKKRELLAQIVHRGKSPRLLAYDSKELVPHEMLMTNRRLPGGLISASATAKVRMFDIVQL